MNTTHQKVLQEEVLLATKLMGRGNLDGAFRHLERVHVLGQTDVRWHVLAHWLMLKIAIRRHQGIAAIGQAVRILLGAIGSAVGRVPTGNTGGSDVSMFARMPIAPELLRVMEGTNLERRAHGYPV
jgi:F0F1-type ATP synthase membrane subunit c/vacuolar-type H+-ATPase subunit K